MTIDEEIEKFRNNAEYERTHGNLQGCLEFRQLADWLDAYREIVRIYWNRNDEILEIHKAEQEKWIPVGERLPEKRGCYIVTEKVFCIDDREHKGRFNTMVEQVEFCSGKWQRASFFEITAWMPLPEPYKAESEDKE